MIMVTSNIYIFLFLLLLHVSLIVVTKGEPIFSYTHVYIRNDLGNNILLTIHCKSKNDDLDVHYLKYQDEYKFQFKPNFLGNTLFFCGLTWDGILHWFNIYVESRDCKDFNCTRNCRWSIQKNYACMFNKKSHAYDHCFDYR
ncbi:putative plant self-incompatibility S1 [Lupinus albus]|uniref:S-protein homolog n=1 Tax=Lupinus albus TaxID=3870 RepID=A0A6A4NW51_LUPAL|nr:putative plant self-incompatibility S1 [Lupinus albus]